MINSKDISVVVQGAIDKENTPICLKSIKNILPEAEIILSTWENSDISNLVYDKVVLNKAPGFFYCDRKLNSVLNNINRQIVSSKEGLKLATRKYSLKMRTDFVLTSDNFLKCFENGINDKRDVKFTFLKNKVVTCTHYSRNPRYKLNVFRMPYCVSDFFYFGLSEDIKKIFDIELVTDINETEYFKLHPDKQKECSYKNGLCRYMPEQYIWMNLCKKHIDNLYCEHRDDDNKKAIALSEKTIVNNVIMKDKKNLSIVSLKQGIFQVGSPENCYSENDVYLLYKYLSEKNYFYALIYKAKIFIQNHIIKKKPKKLKYPKIKNLTKLSVTEAQYVGFDIFDTLLFRKVDPSVVLQKTSLYIELALKKYNKNISAKEVEFLRNKFVYENVIKCYSKKCDVEYKLDNIVKKILTYYDIPEQDRKHLVQNIIDFEVLCEIDCIYPNQEAIILLEKLKNKGKKLYAISDMYLKCDDIKKILKHFDLLKYFENVYVSSEYSLKKCSTKLFKKLLDIENINPGNFIYIGDNKHADTVAPLSIGINGIWYKNKKNLKRKNALEKINKNFYEKQKYIRKILSDRITKEKYYEDYIKNYFAFDFINFVYCAMLNAYKNNVENILFLARDGNIFCEIWNKLYDKLTIFKNIEKLNTNIIKIKRMDANCLSDIDNPYEILFNSSINIFQFSISDLIGKYGLTINDFNQEEQLTINKNNGNIQYFIENYHTIFFPKLKTRQECIVKTLNEKGMFSQRTAILDIGYGGTIQKDIMTYIKKKKINTLLKGYYFGISENIKQINDNVFGYHYCYNLFYGLSLLEFLIKAYENNGQEDLQDTYKYNMLSRLTILDTVDEYAKFMNENLFTPQEIAPFTKYICCNFIHNPKLKFLDYIKNSKFSLDRYPDEPYINLFTKLKKRKDYKIQYGNAQYIEGSLKYSKCKSKTHSIVMNRALLSVLPYFISHNEIKRLDEKLYVSDSCPVDLF